MACGSCGQAAPAGKKYRAEFPDGTVRDYLSRTQAVKALYRDGGGTITAVDADTPLPGGDGA